MAWPAIFAVIADARITNDAKAEPVVEGLLNLVHLEHSLMLGKDATERLAATAAPGSTPLEMTITADLVAVSDTPSGRVIDVAVSVGDIATLRERFLIAGRTGTASMDEFRDSDAASEGIRETPRSFLHQRTVTAPESLRPFAAVTGDKLSLIHI